MLHTTSSTGEGKLYEQIADRVTEMIRAKVLRPGDRVPSIRKMSQQMLVAISTVMEAYRLLEDRGLIEARPQSGYYVRAVHLRHLNSSSAPPEPEMQRLPLEAQPVHICDFVFRMVNAAQRNDLVALGGAIAEPEFLPTEQLNRILARQVRQAGSAALMYQFSPGYDPLRSAIARRAMDAGCTLTSDDIVITTGATEALMLCLQVLTKPGDIVAVESPCYFGMLHLLKCLNLRAVEVCTDPRDGISLKSLEQVLGCCRIQALIVNPNNHNPLGCIMPDEKKRYLAELLGNKGIPILEDDVYGDLSFEPTRPRCIKTFDKWDNVFLYSSYSKTVSPGYRVGWVAPGRRLDEIREFKLATSLASSTPPQLALAWYLDHGGFDRHLRRLRSTFAEQLKIMGDTVRRHFPEGTKATRPSGGHWLWIELPSKVDSLQLFDDALAHGTSLAPGTVFSPTGRYRNYIRLNGAVSWRPEVERAIATIGQLARQQLET